MIQPLRTVHRRAFVTLALVLPAIVAAGLSARHPVSQPVARAKQIPASARVLTNSDNLWRMNALQTEIFADSTSLENRYVIMQSDRELKEPDLLLYWAGNQPSGDSLPAGAKLLGAFDVGRTFALPGAAAQGGHLVLYSLAHRSVADTAAVEKLP
jgi:hypothetical protein